MKARERILPRRRSTVTCWWRLLESACAGYGRQSRGCQELACDRVLEAAPLSVVVARPVVSGSHPCADRASRRATGEWPVNWA
ncbi:hypothetical protein JCM4814A_93170 [Streptomyces phaeofaciens JCM 4814]|uniref:Uncharacterized protein n=1 Tax=Streptomyces phaeofaciens TaxID=68254 RepID=A0A918HKH1_9ACTN|nr:hypothetical protein GCM10010226_56510 [Streptomyces phaeofaciens]